MILSITIDVTKIEGVPAREQIVAKILDDVGAVLKDDGFVLGSRPVFHRGVLVGTIEIL